MASCRRSRRRVHCRCVIAHVRAWALRSSGSRRGNLTRPVKNTLPGGASTLLVLLATWLLLSRRRGRPAEFLSPREILADGSRVDGGTRTAATMKRVNQMSYARGVRARVGETSRRVVAWLDLMLPDVFLWTRTFAVIARTSRVPSSCFQLRKLVDRSRGGGGGLNKSSPADCGSAAAAAAASLLLLAF